MKSNHTQRWEKQGSTNGRIKNTGAAQTKRQQHMETKGSKITKNHDETQMTKRGGNNKQIKMTAPHPKRKTTMRCNHTQSWENKEVPMDE